MAGEKRSDVYDVIVIGGGPSGMMAAITAKREGASVLLLEKNSQCGKKLSLTGHGRCNITNSLIPENFREKYFENAKFLYSAFSAFAPEDTCRFFLGAGITTHEEENGRIFPDSQKAASVVSALIALLEKEGVDVVCDARVRKIAFSESDSLWEAKAENGSWKASHLILATGGKSFPHTGSEGDGYALAKAADLEVTDLTPGLAPIFLKEFSDKKDEEDSMAGLTLSYVGTSLWVEGKKIVSTRAELLFTHQGVSGPGAMRLSRKLPSVSDLYEQGAVVFKIDHLPEMKEDEVAEALLSAMTENPNRHMKRILCETFHFSEKVAERILKDEDPAANSVTKKERNRIVSDIKGMAFEVEKQTPMDIAYVTCGGIRLSQIDPKTMQAKKAPGLFVVGELLDIDGDSGGYNLQNAWATGYVAGLSAARGE
ncbi:MAG: NAD(P)/FAD-dependent oxidoreductase [Clostridiales bacterium]|nr:NAD(P)/FAD-dependent oxidoreductase [Clostridiales bacterium]